MRFCFKSTISVLHCFNIDGFEQWSTIRERIYQKLFVEGKKIDIEIDAVCSKDNGLWR